jgi:enolase-phosphatase E1
VTRRDSSIRVILLDIEGTTTPADFVYTTLFPYASSKLDSFLREHFEDPEIQSLVRDLQTQQQIDDEQRSHPPHWDDSSRQKRLNSAVAYCQWLMAKDSKCTLLKSLQGRIWQQGYQHGALHGGVYDDVAPAMQRWRSQGREINIYSSGSVLAQQLLFRSTAYGDLTKYISEYFDTRVGAKSEPESYRKIAESVGRAPAEFLFISDAQREVAAARLAGMNAELCDRTLVLGRERPLQERRECADRVIHSFDEIFPK